MKINATIFVFFLSLVTFSVHAMEEVAKDSEVKKLPHPILFFNAAALTPWYIPLSKPKELDLHYTIDSSKDRIYEFEGFRYRDGKIECFALIKKVATFVAQKYYWKGYQEARKYSGLSHLCTFSLGAGFVGLLWWWRSKH